MASSYNLLEYDSDEEQKKFPEVPLANLTSAALFVADILERAGIVYGVMGGFAVRLLGSNRTTRDVDIAFQAPGKMKDLWRTVEHESRHVDTKECVWNITGTNTLVIPHTRLITNIMKVFVHTGPGFDNCQAAIPVEIDLIESGFQNSPRDLSANRRKLAVNTTSDQKYIYVVEVSYLLRGKMIAFLARRGNRDLMDIQHLLLTYPNEVRDSANDLDQEAVSFFLETIPAAKRSRWSAVLGR